jgi:two-component system sensor histidine kinase ChvG
MPSLSTRNGCSISSPAKATARATNPRQYRFPDQSGARRASAAAADLTDQTRARIYDRDGVLVLDSRNLYGRGDVMRFELPPPTAEKPGFAEKTMIAIRTWLNRGDLPLYRELGPENGNGYQEVQQALDGRKGSMVRINDRGEVIVSVSVPVQRFRAVHGALMLSTQGDDIDQMVTAERLAILKVFGIAAGVMILLSLLLASTIAGPMRRLADSAERVRRRIKTRVEIPDFTARGDEIGHLSRALRDMTDALYNRIEGIETFRRRRRSRTEEPADLDAVRRRDAAAGALRRQPLAAAGRHRA